MQCSAVHSSTPGIDVRRVARPCRNLPYTAALRIFHPSLTIRVPPRQAFMCMKQDTLLPLYASSAADDQTELAVSTILSPCARTNALANTNADLRFPTTVVKIVLPRVRFHSILFLRLFVSVWFNCFHFFHYHCTARNELCWIELYCASL